MREIKFRAYHEGLKRMCDPNYIDCDGICYEETYWCEGIHIESDNNYILLQFIGLTDKNNKEIYEGDIVKVTDNYIEEECEIGHFIGIVDFNCGSFYVTNKDRTYSNYRLMDLEFEVIGNIYENSELIEE